MKTLIISMALVLILIGVVPGRHYSFIKKAIQDSDVSSLRQSAEQAIQDPCGLEDVVCDGEANEVGVLSAEFSAYNPSPDETDDSPFITADSTDLRKVNGCVIANNSLPFGQQIYIPLLGKVCGVHDRMNRRYGKDNFDIVFAQKSEALKFGRKQLEYEIIE